MLSNLNHPNVLRFYGVVVESYAEPNVIGIMTEYMKGGSLAAFLRWAFADNCDSKQANFKLILLSLKLICLDYILFLGMLCIRGVSANDSSAFTAVNDFTYPLLEFFQYDHVFQNVQPKKSAMLCQC